MEVGLTFRIVAFNRYRTVVSKSCLVPYPLHATTHYEFTNFLLFKYYADRLISLLPKRNQKFWKQHAQNISNPNRIFKKKKKRKNELYPKYFLLRANRDYQFIPAIGIIVKRGPECGNKSATVEMSFTFCIRDRELRFRPSSPRYGETSGTIIAETRRK